MSPNVFQLYKRYLVSLILGVMIFAFACGCSSVLRHSTHGVQELHSSEPEVIESPLKPTIIPETPVYRNPTVAVVELRSHIDEQGRLLGPQLMYQIVDPGGWNIDQVDKYGGRLGDETKSMNQNPLKSTELEAILPQNKLNEVIFTEVMQYSDKPQAELIRLRNQPSFSLIYDSKAGWLLIPPL